MNVVPSLGAERSALVCGEVTRTQIVQYATASGDFSELHIDEPAARAAGNPSVMAHGMLTMAMSSSVIVDWFGSRALRRLSTRFTAAVWPGDSLTATATVSAVERAGGTASVRLSLRTLNQRGQTVLDGVAVVDIDEGLPPDAGEANGQAT